MERVLTPYVLLADDDADDRMLFREIFFDIAADLDLYAVENGKALLDFLNSCGDKLPCLIVLDYNMPLLNGLELLRKLNASRFSDIPKVIFSTSDTITDACLNAGAKKCFVKPLHQNELLAVTREILEYAGIEK